MLQSKVRNKDISCQEKNKKLTTKIEILFREIGKAEEKRDVRLVKTLLRQHQDLVRSRYSLIAGGK